jgi:hypothetical protein
MVPPEFLRQPEFLQVLRLEEKRSRRSGAVFGLVKLEAQQLFGNPREKLVCESLVEALRLSLRDTDQCGWYATGKTMGVIFIELERETARATSESLMNELQARLVKVLPEAKPLRFSVSIFPEREAVPRQRESEHQVVSRR